MIATVATPSPWTDEERDTWSVPDHLTVSECADRNRIISARKGNVEPGPYRTARTPYARGPQDALGDPAFEFVALVKPSQVGGSEVLRNGICSWIIQDPGPCLVVYPTQQSCEEQFRDRLQPMIEDSPALAKYLPGERGDMTRLELDLLSMPIYAGWAGSPQALASRPCRYVVFDEVDKFPVFSGKESDPIALGTARTRTFGHRKKVVMTSTPTTEKGAIWQAFQSCADRRHYYVPCPLCSEPQVLVWPRVRWEGYDTEDVTPEAVEEKGVWYQCQACDGKIPETARDRMVDQGEWISEGYTSGVHPKSRRVGFQFNALIATIGTRWRDLAAKWLRVKGDPAKRQEFVNQELGEPWFDQVDRVKDAAIEERAKSGNKRGVVPPWAACVISVADTQKDRWYWISRAWGAGERSQLVDLGVAKSWDALLAATIDARLLVGATAEKMQPMLLLVDVGGGTATDAGENRTDQVYRWASKDPARILCVKGYGGQGKPFRDVMPGKHTYKRAGYSSYETRVATIDTQKFKDVLAQRINHEPEPGKPCIWELCDGIPPEYLEHMQAEHKVQIRKGGSHVERWVVRSHGRRNDYWDCEVYQLAGSKVVGAEHFPEQTSLEEQRLADKNQEQADDTTEDERPWRRQQQSGGWWNGARRR